METKLHHVWTYTDVDRRFWDEHFADWLPKKIIDAHVHVSHSSFQLFPMTEEMKKQYWVSEVNEPLDLETLCRCYETVYPDRDVSCLIFGQPSLDCDYEKNNDYIEQICEKKGWHGLSVLDPKWSQEKIEQELSRTGVIGLKPYYAMIGYNPDTRDQYIEASIFDFITHTALEILNDRHGWLTLHVPKAARLGHPDNIREVKEIRKRYPDITLVIAHLGRCYTKKHALEGLLPLADDPGIRFDTSAVVNADSHEVALKHIGVERLVYGTDNPIFFMRGRRQFTETSYVNRTSHDFYFNKDRESPEVESGYTLMMYEDIFAIKTAMERLGIGTPENVEKLFHTNTENWIRQVVDSAK